MKVIFLDIDGVLQPYASKKRFEINREELRTRLSEKLNIDYTIYNEYDVAACYADWDKEAVKRIKTIIKETGAKIVVSSDWRSEILLNKMRDLLEIWEMGQYWIGDTDVMDKQKMKKIYEYIKEKNGNKYSYRVIEILYYIYKHKDITNYVVIDDLDLSIKEPKCFNEHFVKTDNWIKDEEMKKCIEILNNNSIKLNNYK